jgi:hypothetical protein
VLPLLNFLFKGKTMKVTQGSNSIEFNVKGGEVKLNLTNDRMIRLHKQLTERVKNIQEEQLGLARDAVEKADAEAASAG